MEADKDKQLAHLMNFCNYSKPDGYVAQKRILVHLKQMSDINHSVKLTTSTYAGFTPLHFLVTSRSINEDEIITLIQWLIDHGANMNAQNAVGSTAIHIAAEYNKKAVLEFLFSCGKLRMDVINKKGISLLHIACMMSNMQMVENILNTVDGQKIVNVQTDLSNFTSKKRMILSQMYDSGETALHIAVLNNSLDIVQLLINHRADLSKKNSKGLTPYSYAVEKKFGQTQHFIKEALLKLNPCTENFEGSEDSAKAITVANSKMRITGFTDLHHMCMENNVLEVKRLLMEQKVDINESISPDSPSWSGYTALHIAVEQSNYKIAELILNSGADVDVKDVRGMTSLHLAVKYKQWSEILLLIDHGADLWARNNEEMTPLHFALKVCDEQRYDDNCVELMKFVELYISYFSSKYQDLVDHLGVSLLHIACMINNRFMVTHILQKDMSMIGRQINFDSPLFPGYTALHLAVQFAISDDIVKILLVNCADYTKMNAHGFTALHLADQMNDFITETLLSFSLILDNPISSEGVSHFHIACQRAHISAAKNYIDHGVDINQSISHFAHKFSGFTPLHLAVRQKCIELIEILLNHEDIMINAVDSFGLTPLNYACRHMTQSSSANILELLLRYNADPNTESLFGERPIEPLIKAFKWCNIDLPKTLLKYGADVNYSNNGFNPLSALFDSHEEHGFFYSYPKLIMLLDNGADATVKDKKGLSVLDKILSTNFQQINNDFYIIDGLIYSLFQKGNDINFQDKTGKTYLHKSIEYSKIHIASALLKNGASISIVDDLNKLPLEYYKKLRSSASEFEFKYTSKNRLDTFERRLHDHVSKLKTINAHIDSKYYEWYLEIIERQMKAQMLLEDEMASDDYLYNLRVSELDKMKQEKLSRYTTLYDVLHKVPSEMAALIENNELKNIICSKKALTDMYPQYGCLLLAKYNEGLTWSNLLQPAKDSLTKLLNGYEIPDACSEEIFKYLTSHNLRKLIESVYD